VYSEVIHSGQWFNTLILQSPTVGSVRLHCFSVWSSLTAAVELIDLFYYSRCNVEIFTTSATVKSENSWTSCWKDIGIVKQCMLNFDARCRYFGSRIMHKFMFCPINTLT